MRRVSVPSSQVVVIGAGASSLVVSLVGDGYRSIVAVDISKAALDQLRSRLGDEAEKVQFLRADARFVELDTPVDVWHDRAVFHFLVDPADAQAYVERARASVRAGGHVVIATFSDHGPEQCSGLPVARYSADRLAAVFDDGFVLVEAFERDHLTPLGAAQSFTHAVLCRSSDDHG